MNEALLKPLSNQKPKAIYPSSLIHAKKVSLDKGTGSEFAATGILTKKTNGLGFHPGKSKSCHKKKVYTMSSMAESLEAALQKIHVEHIYADQRKKTQE